MKIKSEYSSSQSIHTLESLQEKIFEDIKTIRSGNNAQQNCMHLANYIVELIPHYLFGSEKPKKPSTSTSSSIAASYLYSSFIKKEHIPTETTVNYAVNHGDNPLPPTVVPIINEEGATENEIHDLVSDVKRTTIADFAKLQNQLLNSIIDETQFTYGSIALANKTTGAPGHILAYLASKNQVLYIDPQFYDGKTKKGHPIFEFSEFFNHYKDDFKQEVYYLQYGQYNDPQLNKTNNEKAVEISDEFATSGLIIDQKALIDPIQRINTDSSTALPSYGHRVTDNKAQTKPLPINKHSLNKGLLNDIKQWTIRLDNNSFESATQYALQLIERHLYDSNVSNTRSSLASSNIPIDNREKDRGIIQAIDNMHKKLSISMTVADDILFDYGTIALTGSDHKILYSLAYLTNKRSLYYVDPMLYNNSTKIAILSTLAEFYKYYCDQFTQEVCFIKIHSYNNPKLDQRNGRALITLPFSRQNTIFSTTKFKKRPLLASLSKEPESSTFTNDERSDQTPNTSATDLRINTFKEQSMILSLSTTSEIMREIPTHIKYIIIKENIPIEIIKLIPSDIIRVAFFFTAISPEIISALPETVKRIAVLNGTPIGCLMPAMTKGLLITTRSSDQKYTFSMQNEMNSPLYQSLISQTLKISTSSSQLVNNSIFPPNSTSDGMIEEPHTKRVRPSEKEEDNSTQLDL